MRIFTVVLLGIACNAHAAESSVRVTFDTKSAGAAIPEDFSGLSFEVALVLPGPNGVYYFRPDNAPLIRLFQTLGIRNLRIGGNTSDRDAKQLPSEADLDSLFAFAKAAGVKVIYCLRFHNGDPQEAVRTVKYVMDRYASQVDCFSIGQEPSAYPTEKRDTRASTERMGATNEKYRYETYREEWKRFADAIIAEVPNVKLCGPSVHNNADWARRFMADFARSNHVSLITEHLYPGGAGGRVPSPEFGRDRMLSNDFVRVYQRLHDGFVPMAISNSLPFRLEEVNNYFNGGATNVSNTFASALWGLDFMFWWASHSAAGVNFHTGDRVAAGNSLQPSKYTAFFSTTNGYLIRPLGYGIKAFALAGAGRLVPVSISAQPEMNLSAYAVLGADGDLTATFINKEHGSDAHGADVAIAAGNFSHAEVLFLTAPDSDVAATSGVTLGGAEIRNDGSWSGEWKSLPAPIDGKFIFKLPAATAALVRMSSGKTLESTGEPRVSLLNGKYLAETRQKIRSGDKTFSAALASLERDAKAALETKPFSVVSKPITPPSGDKHDYMSEAPYFWPDPAKSNGVPYIRRDGERNPDINKIPNHRDIGRMPEVVEMLAEAYYFTGDEAYARKAAELLRAWFLDPATRMNPNLQYAQAVIGVNDGRGTGLIESRGLVHVVDAIGLLAGSRSWTKADDDGLRRWFGDFLDWMLTSRNGRDEGAAKNNHGTYYDVQVVSFALFLDRNEFARNVLQTARTKRIAVQIEPDGRQPLELVRTKAWSYSVGNLSGLMQLATLGERAGIDLWHFETADGRSIRRAFEYLVPFGTREKAWPHQQLGGWSPEGFMPLLRDAAAHYPDSNFKELVQKLSRDNPADRRLLLSSPVE